MGHRLMVRVSPLVRIAGGSNAMLSLELTRPSDDKPVSEVAAEGDGDDSFSVYAYMNMFDSDVAGPSGVRLIDAEGGRVWFPGLSAGRPAVLDRGDTISCSLIFTAIDLDQVIAMIPQCGFLTLAVVDQDTGVSAGVETTAIEKAQKVIRENGLKDNADAPAALERYVRVPDDSTGTRTTTKEVTVTLASDVTFEVDSADLTPQADAQLQTVASQAAQYPEGGMMEIVGHTDDVADDDYNQALSEKRAQAVSDRLGQLADLGAWQTSVTGKGESEPAVDDTTDEARAANRRVVITLTPTGGTKNPSDSNGASATPSTGSSAGLPETTGPVGKGPEGVTVTGPQGKGQITVTLDHATRTGGLLLGQLTVTTGPGGTGGSTVLTVWLSDGGGLLSRTSRGEEGGISTISVSDGLPLLTPGGELLFPSDYLHPASSEHVPLTELRTYRSLKEGATTTICVAWPDTGQDTLTLDHPARNDKGDYAFRLTDIPVVEG